MPAGVIRDPSNEVARFYVSKFIVVEFKVLWKSEVVTFLPGD